MAVKAAAGNQLFSLTMGPDIADRRRTMVSDSVAAPILNRVVPAIRRASLTISSIWSSVWVGSW